MIVDFGFLIGTAISIGGLEEPLDGGEGLDGRGDDGAGRQGIQQDEEEAGVGEETVGID
jgi:hypothetical protein